MDLGEIGLLFKDARRRSRRTQEELAQALGMVIALDLLR